MKTTIMILIIAILLAYNAYLQYTIDNYKTTVSKLRNKLGIKTWEIEILKQEINTNKGVR